MATQNRSEEMELYSLILSKDYAWEVMDELGKKNALHFIDLNLKGQAYNKPYLMCIKRCDETERRIRYDTWATLGTSSPSARSMRSR